MVVYGAKVWAREAVRSSDYTLGSGGHASVIKGYDVARNRVIALKQIRVDERCSLDTAKRVSRPQIFKFGPERWVVRSEPFGKPVLVRNLAIQT